MLYRALCSRCFSPPVNSTVHQVMMTKRCNWCTDLLFVFGRDKPPPPGLFVDPVLLPISPSITTHSSHLHACVVVSGLPFLNGAVPATSYEDTVGGVLADVVILFRPAGSASAPGAKVPAAAVGAAGVEVAVGGKKEEEEEGAGVLTVVVRPLPGTAPASVDSGSSRGGVCVCELARRERCSSVGS